MPLPWNELSRRSLFRVAGVTALGAGALGRVVPIASAATADPYSAIRAAWATMTGGGAIDPTNAVYRQALSSLGDSAKSVLSTVDTSSGRTQLFTDLPIGTNSANVTSSFKRLETLALAYTTPGTAYTGDSSLGAIITGGLDFLVANAYKSDLPIYGYGNWWDWQIGSPQALQDTANLLYAELSPTQIASYCAAIDHFVPDPTTMVMSSGNTTSTGANRLDMCRVVIIRGALGADSDRISTGVAGIGATLPFVTSGDGLYSDGSFIQHTWIAYTGTYGNIWLGDVAKLISILAGTQWAVADPNLGNVFFAAKSAFVPVVYNGLMLDFVRGRAISRASESDADDGSAAARNFIILSGGAPDSATATWLKSTAKGWLQRTPLPVASGSVASIALSERVLADSSIKPAAEPIEHSLFPNMDRTVHRRSGWAVGISMASNRITYYETGNGENLRGWHTGDGMTYTYLDSDNTQYNDDFWPTVDPYRLPGITASTKTLTDAEGGGWGASRPDASWVGGATDGEFAAIGQDLRGPFSTLVAKKSWFCLDDAIVCLGAGITCTDGVPVETIVDNRLVGSSTLTVGGKWAHLDGQSGYIFPYEARVSSLRQSRTGSWQDINTGQSATPITRTYETLWIDHGTDPTDDTYAYLLLPGAARHQVLARAADRHWLQVWANSAAVQGISVASLGVTAANFWVSGRAGDVAATAPACVLIREHRDHTATMCVSDPARANTALTITWNRPVRAVVSKPASVTGDGVGRSLRLEFGDMTGLAGATQTITVALR